MKLPHPQSGLFDALANNLFLVGQVVLIKKFANFFPFVLIDHALKGLMQFEGLFYPIWFDGLFKKGHQLRICLRIEQRQGAIVVRH